MKPPKHYASAAAFRVALESRLKTMAQEEGFDLQRLRRQAAFDRLLCRLFAKPDAPWLLKGGYAMELRLKLGFAGVASATLPAVSPEEQFAEKLHAYTLPRLGRENTRVKDLVDLALLIERTRLDLARLPKAIRETFQRRKTHEIPSALIPPPDSWTRPFSEMAVECELEPDMEKYFDLVAHFFRRLDS